MFRFPFIPHSIRFSKQLVIKGLVCSTPSRRLVTQPTHRELTNEQATQKVNELTSLIRAAQAAYYNTPNTLIDDDQFDMLFEELVELETKYVLFTKLSSLPSPTRHSPDVVRFNVSLS